MRSWRELIALKIRPEIVGETCSWPESAAQLHTVYGHAEMHSYHGMSGFMNCRDSCARSKLFRSQALPSAVPVTLTYAIKFAPASLFFSQQHSSNLLVLFLFLLCSFDHCQFARSKSRRETRYWAAIARHSARYSM